MPMISDTVGISFIHGGEDVKLDEHLVKVDLQEPRRDLAASLRVTSGRKDGSGGV